MERESEMRCRFFSKIPSKLSERRKEVSLSLSLSLSLFGRWGAEARGWLRDAVDAVAERDPRVAAAGHWGKVAVLNAWHS